jgi:hypothetical protein
VPQGLFVPRIDATRGEIWIPSLSVLVARLQRPALTRRPEGETPYVGQFDLQAAYSYLQIPLFQDADFRKEWTIWIGKKPLTATLHESSRIEIIEHARVLRVEGVDIAWQQRQPAEE